MNQWRNFKEGLWNSEINVSDFIKRNYTPYFGDSDFLQGTTERTTSVRKKVEELLIEENNKGGVLNIDTDHVSSILSHKPGYVDKEKDIIVGLQTDEPLKRAVNPFAGYRNAVQACQAYGYEIGENINNEFKYRTTTEYGVINIKVWIFGGRANKNYATIFYCRKHRIALCLAPSMALV